MEILVNFEKLEHGSRGIPVLKLSLTPAGREAIEDENLLQQPTYDALIRLIEYQLANGWDWINPDEIGALTDSPILSDSALRDDQGNIIEIPSLFWFPNYQILDEVEELFLKGFVEFERVDS